MSLDDAVADFVLSRDIIQDVTGQACQYGAFPLGKFDDRLLEAISPHFTAVVSTAGGVIRYRQTGGKVQFRNSLHEHYPENISCLNRVYGL